MIYEIIIAGFGGQGIMSIGKILALAGMLDNKHVTWFPSYGAEMRGGTANCSVIISSKTIGSPIISKPCGVITMNQPSLDKFAILIKPYGTLFINSSLSKWLNPRKDIEVIAMPVTEMADRLGAVKVANIIALSAFCVKTRIVSWESLEKATEKSFSSKNKNLMEINSIALNTGRKQIKVLN